jgi:hypothetical protein
MTVARRRGDERLVVQWVGEDLGAGVVEVLLADRDDAGGDAPGVLQGDADLVGDVGEPAGVTESAWAAHERRSRLVARIFWSA